MKRLFFILLLICGFATTANAQFYGDTFFFVQVGVEIKSSTSIAVFDYNGSGDLSIRTLKAREVIEKYNNGTLYSYLAQAKHNEERDYSIDSSKYTVYSYKYVDHVEPQSIWTGSGWSTTWNYVYNGRGYYGITSDAEEAVSWRTTKNSTEPKERKHYKRISISELAQLVDEYGFLH